MKGDFTAFQKAKLLHFFGVRRQDGAFSGPAGWSALWPARRVAPSESGDVSPHSKFIPHPILKITAPVWKVKEKWERKEVS